MSAISLENAVKSTIEEIMCISPSEITSNSTMQELGFDSMDFLDFVYKLEEKIDKDIDIKKIEFKSVEKFTIQDLIYEIQKI